MALTKDFKDTVRERAQKDPKFRALLLQEAVESFLEGEFEESKLILRNYINATIGFEELAGLVDKSPKSLMRMLSSKGNPAASNLVEILASLQKQEGVHFQVKAVNRCPSSY